jgi:hypothetical protein
MRHAQQFLMPAVLAGDDPPRRFQRGNGGGAQKARRMFDLDRGLGIDRPGFADDPRDQLFAMALQRIGGGVQNARPLRRRCCFPAGLRGRGGGRGAGHIGRIAFADRRDMAAVGGGRHIGLATKGGRAPATRKDHTLPAFWPEKLCALPSISFPPCCDASCPDVPLGHHAGMDEEKWQ